MTLTEGRRYTGIVTFYNRIKGFGFVRVEGCPREIFVGSYDLKRSGIQGPLYGGEHVEFTMLLTSQGPKTINLIKLD